MLEIAPNFREDCAEPNFARYCFPRKVNACIRRTKL